MSGVLLAQSGRPRFSAPRGMGTRSMPKHYHTASANRYARPLRAGSRGRGSFRHVRRTSLSLTLLRVAALELESSTRITRRGQVQSCSIHVYHGFPCECTEPPSKGASQRFGMAPTFLAHTRQVLRRCSRSRCSRPRRWHDLYPLMEGRPS